MNGGIISRVSLTVSMKLSWYACSAQCDPHMVSVMEEDNSRD